MENENDIEVDETTEDKAEETKEPVKEPEKPKLTLEQQRGILKRKLTKVEKELGLSEEKPEKKEEKKDELDLTQLGYLEMKGIESDEEINFIKDTMKRSGDDLRTTLKSDFVQSKLKSMRDAKAVLDATPSGTKASPQKSAKDSVEYWLEKPIGEFPADPALRLKVVNARIERDKSGIKFYNSPQS